MKKLYAENWLNSLCINLTNRCNTYCKYCFQESIPDKNDYIVLKDIKKVLDFFEKKGAGKIGNKYLQLTGGEVTLHKDFFEIMELGLSYGYYMRIQTNAIS
ncbi:MAG TPA: radical SAM protein, partial [Elusimicrobiales bacterium]|nr:radical SAM protein [Elusimicrobiales bacterium]